MTTYLYNAFQFSILVGEKKEVYQITQKGYRKGIPCFELWKFSDDHSGARQIKLFTGKNAAKNFLKDYGKIKANAESKGVTIAESCPVESWAFHPANSQG